MDEMDPCYCAVHAMSCEHSMKLLAEERKLSAFRQERWMNAEQRLERTWNEAVEACRNKLPKHTPPCRDDDPQPPCNLCWIHAKLTGLLRLDRAGYKTVRERIETARQAVIKSIPYQDAEGEAARAAANKMAGVISELFGVNE